MKPRHLILIVLIGTGLVIVAPTAEKAGQAEETEIAAKPAEDVAEQQPEPASERSKIIRASFDGQTEKLENTNN